ncbi:glutathione transport system permease protein GsiD [Ruminiclostridium hungatei]|uniref:Glutathione transport system permease protein GsiD n=2 Tax=Ruminiclostridium hungatei TaxID=48256 RepID=A0A1V4SN76_RUMHU|nr:glutathione transport system permease protein GsiD [Ruminiclostridium hungatei]
MHKFNISIVKRSPGSNMKRKKTMVVGLALIAAFILIALWAPVLAPNDPNATDLSRKNAAASAEFPLGCDQMGRCELSRILYGARYSMGLSVPVLVLLAAVTLFAGCYCGYKGGIADRIAGLFCDILMAFPLIVIAMALVTSIDNSVLCILAAISISMSAWFMRMVRSYARSECGKEYIESARLAGASELRIVMKHLIPNVLPQFLIYFTTGIASAIISVSSFAFLGIGLIAGTPEWGAMLNEARNSIYTNPGLIIYPGICLVLCCAGFNLFGEGLRDFIGREDEINAT